MNSDTAMRRLLELAAFPGASLPESARTMARFSLFDWMVVARAGADQPLCRIIREFVESEGGRPSASVVGALNAVPTRAAALANGTISHALDYDDTHFAHVAHPSVAIMPAALAAAEEVNASASDVVDAFLIGAEASCRVGMTLGRGHYLRGFHQTATSGAFGATVAAGRIFGLTDTQMRHALGLVSTRASGLKSQFGTMGKPFNAGIAAANGIEAASLARLGFDSCDDGLFGPQGFVETHSDEPAYLDVWENPALGVFIFEDVKYKLHACCHGTHAMIEALAETRRQNDIAADRIDSIRLRVNPRWLTVCDIKKPRTGLEVKFSYGLLAAMVLRGVSTSADDAYTDALCGDPALLALSQRVVVTGDETVSDTATSGVITLIGGDVIDIAHDLSARLSTDLLQRGLRSKAQALIGEAMAETLWAAMARLDQLSACDIGRMLVA